MYARMYYPRTGQPGSSFKELCTVHVIQVDKTLSKVRVGNT
jgi:hypothetical protein